MKRQGGAAAWSGSTGRSGGRGGYRLEEEVKESGGRFNSTIGFSGSWIFFSVGGYEFGC